MYWKCWWSFVIAHFLWDSRCQSISCFSKQRPQGHSGNSPIGTLKYVRVWDNRSGNRSIEGSQLPSYGVSRLGHGLETRLVSRPVLQVSISVSSVSGLETLNIAKSWFRVFSNENVRYPVWTCRDPVCTRYGPV